MKKTALLILLSCFSLLSFAQKDEALLQHYRQEWKSLTEFMYKFGDRSVDTTYDVLFYHLDLKPAIDSAWLEGNVLMKAKATQDNVQQITLDLNRALNVDSITGNATAFAFAEDRITVDLDAAYNANEEFSIHIYYSGVPALAGGYKGMRWEIHGPGEPVIATLSTPFLAHYWYPCKDGPQDKPDSVYVDIIIPDTSINGLPLKAVSNGLLDTIVDLGDLKTFKWKHRYPVVTYYVMAAISNYREYNQQYSNDSISFPLDYYIFDEDYNAAVASLEDFPQAFDVFNDLFGIYPFYTEKYGMTQLGYYGAIENQTNTIIGQMNSGWYMTYIHELGHMWFGDMITCESWEHGWLNEGFATYSEALYLEAVEGFEAYLDDMENNEYFLGGTLYLNNPDTFEVFQSIIYSKGAYVLHMLRGVLGDEVFFDCLKTYATDTQFMYANATTEEFRDVCEDVSGEELDYFFDQWIYDMFYPIYHYNFSYGETHTDVTLKQSQGNSGWREVFEMPVQLRVVFENGSDTVVTVWNDQQLQEYRLQFSKNVLYVYVDPQKWILRKVHYDPGLPVGIKEHTASSINIYPNPTAGGFSVEYPAEFGGEELHIYNVQGRLVYSSLLPPKSSIYKIQAALLNEGVYIIRIKNEVRYVVVL